MTANTTISNISNHHHNNHLAISVCGRCGPSLIKHKNLRFLITDKPTDATLNQYIEELQKKNVTDVVRVCESTYSSKRLEQEGIKCHDWAFDDGTPPPQKIIENWLNLIIERFKECPIPLKNELDRKISLGHAQSQSQSQQGNGSNSANDSPTNKVDNQLPCIAVHCVAGLGRAPVLVAIALIESGLKYEDAVEMIRAARRGAINAKQLDYLSQYKPKKLLVFNNRSSSKRKFCSII